MNDYQLDYSDVVHIFKEKLKIDNIVKSINSVFKNERYFNKINYKPYFQRNYVWDDEKATYFIESILLGTEIPPLVLFESKMDNEVIDGRQRFETINRFLNDKLVLKNKGLHSLKKLSGKKYSQIDKEIQENFLDTKIRILQFKVVNEPRLDEYKEDKIKKEIFRRYNSGITPLQKYDIERAIFIDDPLSNLIMDKLNNDYELFDFLCKTILPRSKKKANKRDKINVLLTEIRDLITLPYVSIYEYAKTSKIDLIRRNYFEHISSSNINEQLNLFIDNMKTLKMFYLELDKNQLSIKSIKLFFECLYWGVCILKLNGKEVKENEISIILNNIKMNVSDNYWCKINNNPQRDYELLFEQTGSHYYGAVMNRYTFISNVFGEFYKINLYEYVKKKDIYVVEDTINEEYERYRINKALPETLSIEDIMMDIKKSRFLIRPNYQRSEVKNNTKASYLMESVLLGINIPPLFVYKRKDNVKEVVDGQQRLLTLLGYLGEHYIDELGNPQFSEKNKFKLSELKILSELKGVNIDNISEMFKDKILDFPMDIIEIDGNQNPAFSPIDLFLRLNTKPYPIQENTFEMWNAYLDKEIVLKVKDLANKYSVIVFRPQDPRMKLEELITSLAYIDYKVTNGSEINNVLCMYKRNERFCARLMSKTQMTKQLYDISINNKDNFMLALENVETFAKKVLFLIDNDSSQIKKLFNHSRKGTSYKTDQNFYFLWLMLSRITIQEIQTKRKEIFNKVRDAFDYLQNIPDDIQNVNFQEILN